MDPVAEQPGGGVGPGAGEADPSWTRRTFLERGSVVAGAAAFGLIGCGGEGPSDAGARSTTTGGAGGMAGGTQAADVPDEDTIFSWVREIFDQGIRRPGYPADEWAETWVADRFRDLGLDEVRAEPFTARRWEPESWSLEVEPSSGERREIRCYPVPFSAPTDGVEVELVRFSDVEGGGASVDGRASLVDVSLLALPADFMATAGSVPDDTDGRVFDPEGTFADSLHRLPFGAAFQEVMEPSIEAGAAVFVGALRDYPGDSVEYFVPYDGVDRPIPGIWISGSAAAQLDADLDAGPVRIRLVVRSETTDVESANIVGEIEGADDEVVMIASHHDGPWASAVEDGSGMALVLAQAAYWAAQPVEHRPHRLVFVMQGGHMSGGAGLHAYIEAHRAELADVVLEIHLEHAALEAEERDGEVVVTDRAVPRWFFTSRIPDLEAAVAEAIEAEELWRSMIVAPDAFGEQPPTDGAYYHAEGVPIVHFLAAPFYLFDRMDTLDKVDRAHLVPLTRATIRIVEATWDHTAAGFRAAVVAPTPGASAEADS